MSDKIRAAVKTAIQSSIVWFLLPLAGWLQEIYKWASSSGVDPLPKVSTLGYAAVAAGMAALTGLVSFIGNLVQETFGIGKTPIYTPAVRDE